MIVYYILYFPFSHLYIIVAYNVSVIENVKEIATQDLLKKTNQSSPLYYVAAVIYSDQYNSNYTMTYILGASDTTTDSVYGYEYINREVQGSYYYFYRVFSANSTEEVLTYTMTLIISIYMISLE